MKYTHNKHNKTANNNILIILLLLFVFWPIRDFGVSAILYEFLVSAILIIYILKNNILLKITKINRYFIFISIIILIQFILPNASEDSRQMLPIVLNLLLTSLCVMSSNTNEKVFKSFVNITYISGIVYSLYLCFFTICNRFYISNILPLLKGVDKHNFERLINAGYGIPIAGSVVFVSYLIMLCVSILIMIIITKKYNVISNKYCVFGLIVFTVAQFFIGRRGEAMVLIITIIIVCLFSNGSNLKENIRKIISMIVLLIFGLIVVNLLIKNGYLTRFVKMSDKISSGINDINDLNSLSTNRINLWVKAIDAFKTKPFFGIGLGQFRTNVNTETSVNVHNTYLQFLCESGIIGFVILVIPIIFLYINTLIMYRKCINQKKDKKIVLILGISFSIQTYFLILNFIDPAFYKSFYAFVYGISIILLEYSIKEQNNIIETNCNKGSIINI